MVNSTSVTHFILAYMHTGSLRYLYFVIIALLYITIVFTNTTLIGVVCVKRSLHEPMYIFLCSLLVNEVYGSAGLFPLLMAQIVSDPHTLFQLSRPLCFLQVYCLYTYGNVEFCNLAVMSYDRYIAICSPLQYHSLMTTSKVAVLIAVAWVYPLLNLLITLFLSMRLSLCGNVINKLYCQNHHIVKLACSPSDTKANNIYGLVATVFIICIPLTPILFSYIKILKICVQGSKETRQKAISTCSPHLASLVNFSFGCFFEIVQSRFGMTDIPAGLRNFLSLYFLICQPLLNPILYGLRMPKIRFILCHFLQCRHLRVSHVS